MVAFWIFNTSGEANTTTTITTTYCSPPWIYCTMRSNQHNNARHPQLHTVVSFSTTYWSCTRLPEWMSALLRKSAHRQALKTFQGKDSRRRGSLMLIQPKDRVTFWINRHNGKWVYLKSFWLLHTTNHLLTQLVLGTKIFCIMHIANAFIVFS